MKRRDTQIPPKGLVRIVAVVVLLVGLVLMYAAVMGASALGLMAILIFLSGLVTTILASAAIYTGDPTWILLDLIVPGW